jgi:hypothetical protein
MVEKFKNTKGDEYVAFQIPALLLYDMFGSTLLELGIM